jgi:tRNA-specific 2-thiouridylase
MVKKWKLWQEYARQPLQAATLHQFENGMCSSEPQSAITEGQFVAWYMEDELVGSGVIS